MIKFIAIALVAFVAVGQCSADTADDETSLLMGNEKLFADFCRKERSEIVADIKSRVNVKSSLVYNLFFEKFFIEITDEVLGVSREQVEKFTKHIRDPASSVEKEVPETPLSEEEVQKMVSEGLENIQKTTLLGRLRGATLSVASAMYNTANSAIYARLAQLRTKLDRNTLLQGVVDSCAQVREYETKLEADLEQAKARLMEHDQPEVRQFIQSVSVPTLKCQSTKYVSRLQGFCTVLIDGTGYLLKMLGLGSEFVFPAPTQ